MRELASSNVSALALLLRPRRLSVRAVPRIPVFATCIAATGRVRAAAISWHISRAYMPAARSAGLFFCGFACADLFNSLFGFRPLRELT